MQWRRGLAFAAVHVAVALPIVASLEAGDAAMLRDHYSQITPPSSKPVALTSGTETSVDTVLDFSICGMIDEFSPRERIIVMANLPAAFLTAWRMPCPPRWSVSGMLLGVTWERLTPARQVKQRGVDAILLLLIAIQWLLIGGFPVRPHEKLRRDPATLITICTAAAGALSFLPQMNLLSELFLVVVPFTWLYWLALLAWKLLRLTRSRIFAARTQPNQTG